MLARTSSRRHIIIIDCRVGGNVAESGNAGARGLYTNSVSRPEGYYDQCVRTATAAAAASTRAHTRQLGRARARRLPRRTDGHGRKKKSFVSPDDDDDDDYDLSTLPFTRVVHTQLTHTVVVSLCEWLALFV